MADTQDFHHGWADWDTSVLERFAEHLAQEMADAARAGQHLRAAGLAQWREDTGPNCTGVTSGPLCRGRDDKRADKTNRGRRRPLRQPGMPGASVVSTAAPAGRQPPGQDDLRRVPQPPFVPSWDGTCGSARVVAADLDEWTGYKACKGTG